MFRKTKKEEEEEEKFITGFATSYFSAKVCFESIHWNDKSMEISATADVVVVLVALLEFEQDCSN